MDMQHAVLEEEQNVHCAEYSLFHASNALFPTEDNIPFLTNNIFRVYDLGQN